MANKIRVLLIKVGEEPRVVEIENTLQALQEAVGGYIEVKFPPIHDDSAVLVCNEEGKFRGLEPNVYLANEWGDAYGVVFGDCIVLDAPIDSDDFGGLSDEQIAKYMAFYGQHV